MNITLFDRTGKYADNKDTARDIRTKQLIPALEKSEVVTLDFAGVETATQSFIHALVSEAISRFGSSALDSIVFKSCNESIKQLIRIVTDYMQDAVRDMDD